MMRSAATKVNPGASCCNHGPFCLTPGSAILPTCPPIREPVLTVSEQLDPLLGYPWPFPARPPKPDLSTCSGRLARARAHLRGRGGGARAADLCDELFGARRGSEKETYAMTPPRHAALTCASRQHERPSMMSPSPTRSAVLKWRRERDSNPRYGFPYTHFPGVRLQPLGHPSAGWIVI